MKRNYLLSALLTLPFFGAACPDNRAPVTEAEFSPLTRTFRVKTRTDQDLTLKGLKSKTSRGGQLDIDELVFKNSASSVIREQQEMMDRYDAQLKTLAASWADTIRQLKEITAQLLPMGAYLTKPYANLPLSNGTMLPDFQDITSQTQTLLDLKEKLDALQKKLNPLVPISATQPVP